MVLKYNIAKLLNGDSDKYNIKNFKEEFQKIKQAFLDDTAGIPRFSEWNTVRKDALKNKALGEVRAEYVQILERYLHTLNKYHLRLSDKINHTKYPLFMSSDLDKKALGSKEIESAKTYLSNTRPADKIVKAIEHAKELNRIDYLSSLIEEILDTTPTGEKGIELKSMVQHKANELFKETHLPELENERREIPRVQNQAKEFKQMLEMGLVEVKNFKEWSKRELKLKNTTNQFL